MGGGKKGASDTTPPLGGARQRILERAPYVDICGREKGGGLEVWEFLGTKQESTPFTDGMWKGSFSNHPPYERVSGSTHYHGR